MYIVRKCKNEIIREPEEYFKTYFPEQVDINNRYEDRVWMLLAKKLSNEVSDQESDELDQLLKYSPEMACTCELITLYWNCSAEEERSGETTFFGRPGKFEEQ
ncbi:MAG: hypothetical protein J0I84_21355 [Terrimonas sp.]|nr:hypothetical protein [Terrimonas sp.]OJY92146.1 MAG: hypothetical protein BGP13_08245 [Sphingobacteriales bacterium 40-81]